MSKYAELINNKPKLLILVVIGVIGSLSIPVLLPHFDHGAHIYHLLLHAGGIILSVFLTILGINAYYKIRSRKLAITSIAFFVFSIAEIVSLHDATTHHYYDLPAYEIAHILMIVMVGIFALGIFKGD
jgi:hypothetical protein